MIDLHTHTTASDGSCTPGELVALAQSAGVTVLGITDHDTIDGLDAARRAAAAGGSPLEIVPGVEFSAEYSPGTMHLLGYFIDPENGELLGALEEMRHRRNTRNPRIVAALQAAGFDITIEEVVAGAGGDSIGRPHIAAVMVKKGYVASVDEAFAHWLDRGRPAYVSQERIAPAEAIRVIQAAGGVAVLAHPYQLRPQSTSHLEQIVRELRGLGLQGIETWYSRHTPEMTEAYLALAKIHGLVSSGGSDFHGTPKPDIQLGIGCGNLRVPPGTVENLRASSRAAKG